MKNRSVAATLVTLALAGAYTILVGEWPAVSGSGSADPSPSRTQAEPAERASSSARRSDDDRVEAAFRERRSNVWVELAGIVDKTLRDDTEGSRHQKFIVRLASGRTVLIAHNIDLADRVPVKRGDDVRLRGEYEWNDRGGVVHWTHHDPDGRSAGGWIEAGGQRYR